MTAILLLGGTDEAADLAERLEARGADFITSLASGRDGAPAGRVRRGGFGSPEAMAQFLRDDGVAVVVDGTDPFAAVVSPTAKRAARLAGVRYFRLERRPWRRSGGDRWTDVATLEDAAARIDDGARVFLAVGAGELAPFLHRRDLTLVLCAPDGVDVGPRHDVTVVRGRGPLGFEEARDILSGHRIDALVAKNTGGDAEAALLVAARERRLHVFMVTRPSGQPWANARTADQMVRKLWRYLPRR